MTSSEGLRWLRVATRVANAAAARLAGGRQRAVRRLEGREVKIAADGELNALILEQLSKASEWPVLTEESGWTSPPMVGGMRWIVDPLDGSVNYSRGLPLCAISVALWRGAMPLIGVVVDPGRKEVYQGLVGHGAWLNGQAIHTGSATRPETAILCTGFPVALDLSGDAVSGFIGDVRRFRRVRLLGTAALSLAFVAAGRADAYLERQIKIWDVAAGLALVAAAGGRIRIVAGSAESTHTVLATNGRLRGWKPRLR